LDVSDAIGISLPDAQPHKWKTKRTSGSGLAGTRINPSFLLAHLDPDVVVDLFEEGISE